MEYIIAIIGLVIWGVILNAIIYGATKTEKRLKNDQIIIKLLSNIAIKQGVTDEEVDLILNPPKKRYDWTGKEIK